MPGKVTKHLRIFGKVQGVGYRAWAASTASAMHLTGWVRNRKDGSVELVVTGHPDDVARFVLSCHSGPPSARVDALSENIGIDEHLKDFAIHDTV